MHAELMDDDWEFLKRHSRIPPSVVSASNSNNIVGVGCMHSLGRCSRFKQSDELDELDFSPGELGAGVGAAVASSPAASALLVGSPSLGCLPSAAPPGSTTGSKEGQDRHTQRAISKKRPLDVQCVRGHWMCPTVWTIDLYCPACHG